jgi:hypothetical protein
MCLQGRRVDRAAQKKEGRCPEGGGTARVGQDPNQNGAHQGKPAQNAGRELQGAAISPERYLAHPNPTFLISASETKSFVLLLCITAAPTY